MTEVEEESNIPEKSSMNCFIFCLSFFKCFFSIKIRTIIKKAILSGSLSSALSNTVYIANVSNLGHIMMINVSPFPSTALFYLLPLSILSPTSINSDYKCLVTGAVLFHVFEILSVIR